MIRLLATDIDGTLVKVGGNDLNPAYFNAINTLKAMGIKVLVTSGRSVDRLYSMFSPVLKDLYISGNNGANIFYNDNEILGAYINEETYKKIIHDMIDLPDSFPMLSTVNQLYYFPNITGNCLEFCKGYGFNLKLFESYSELGKISKICVKYMGTAENPAKKFMNSYDDVVAYDAGDGWIDFVPAGVSKGAGVKLIQAMNGISPEESICFGDQENDISMFERCKFNFAVENASDIAYKAAKYHTDSYGDNGVLKVMNRIINGENPFEV